MPPRRVEVAQEAAAPAPTTTTPAPAFIVDSSELAGPPRSHMFVALCPSRSGAIYATFRRGGDKSQEERDWVLQEFKDGNQPVLIATDVAQRGLDIKDVKKVIN